MEPTEGHIGQRGTARDQTCCQRIEALVCNTVWSDTDRRVWSNDLSSRADEPAANAAVARTRCGLQPFPVQDFHRAVQIPNDAGILQRTGNSGDARSLRAQRLCEKLLTEIERIATHTVVRLEEPPRVPLSQRVDRMTRGQLHHLRDQRLRVRG